MKRAWLLVLCVFAVVSCNAPKDQKDESIDLIKKLTYSEKIDSYQLIVFGTPVGKRNVLSGWLPRNDRQDDQSFQWAVSNQSSIAFNWSKPETLYLHIKARSAFPNYANVFLNNQNIGTIQIRNQADVQSIQLPSAMLTPDRNVVEFAWKELRPLTNEDTKAAAAVYFVFITPAKHLVGDPVADIQNAVTQPTQLKVAGKLHSVLSSNIGSTTTYYEKLNKNAQLQFGIFYDAPSTAEEDDFANFEISLQREGEKEQIIFKKRANEELRSRQSIALSKYIHSNEPEPYKIVFQIRRNSILDSGKAAWIEPVLDPGFTDQKQVPEKAIAKIREANEDANVIIILMDAAGAKHLSTYGYFRKTTPNIEKLARDGIQFQRAYCQAVYTLASTASLMSGLDPYRHRTTDKRNKLPENVITLAERFAAAGYHTGTFTANGNAGPAFGMTQGFQDVNEVDRQPNYTGWAADVTNTFTQWLQKLEKDRRFFAYLHYREPHGPFNPPSNFKNYFRDPKYTRFDTASDEMRRKLRTGEITETQADRDFITASYDENLRYGDYEVGRLLNVLKNLKLYDRTILILIADHGEAFWEHDFQGHNSQLYEESVRIPYIVKLTSASGIKNKRISTPVRTIDTYPSLVDLLQLSHKDWNVDGQSFLPYLASDKTQDVPVFSQTLNEEGYSLTEGHFKYIYHRFQGTDELYDLNNDPEERKNLINEKPIQRGYMKTRIFGWQRAIRQAEMRVAKNKAK